MLVSSPKPPISRHELCRLLVGHLKPGARRAGPNRSTNEVWPLIGWLLRKHLLEYADNDHKNATADAATGDLRNDRADVEIAGTRSAEDGLKNLASDTCRAQNCNLESFSLTTLSSISLLLVRQHAGSANH